jgi:hypothetical protein
MIVDGNREDLLGVLLTDDVVVEIFLISFGAGMPSCDFTSEDLFSSSMMSMHSSTHSSQMNTAWPAMSLRTSCWLLPQNVQWSGFLVSPPLTLLISEPQLKSHRSRSRSLEPPVGLSRHPRSRHMP